MYGDWSDEQNDAIVADYFAMLADDRAGRSYNKAAHNRVVQAKTGRPRGSIEYKHQNISAVLKALGEDWIPGYKPAFNFQTSLIDAVVRGLGALEASPHMPSVDYDGFLKATLAITHSMADVEQAFRRMVFNVLSRNRDDHVRQHAYLMNDRGDCRPWSWRSAP